MHQNKLLNLLARNAQKGEFRAEANTIYLYDVIVSSKAEADWLGGVDAETFVKTLKSMDGDVTVRVNCPGGDVFAGRAMAQAIRDHSGTVTVYVDGYAASAATFVTSAADKTVMSQGSMLMVHKAWAFAMGNADDFKATASLLEKIDGTIAESYVQAAEKRGIAPPDFAAMMAAETWFTAQEAMDAGLADEVTAETIKAQTKWDLSAYENAPQDAVEVTVTVTVEVEDPAEEAAEPADATDTATAQNEIDRRCRISALALRSPA